MLVALHSSLRETSSDPLGTDLSELTLQTMDIIANHCGTALGTLVQAQRQVWLAQSSLPEVCRNNLRRLLLVPGKILDQLQTKHVSVSETRSRHVGTASGPRPSLAASGTRFHNIGVRPTSSQHFHHRNSRTTPPPPPTPRRGGTQPRGYQSHIRPLGPKRHPPTSTEKYLRERWPTHVDSGLFHGKSIESLEINNNKSVALDYPSRGYRIQFHCRPPVHTGVRQTIVHVPRQALAHKVLPGSIGTTPWHRRGVNGTWRGILRTAHINVLELTAVFLTLLHF